MTLDEAKTLVSNVRATFESPQGKSVMEYLEKSCYWFESIYDNLDKDRILINAGRREVLATLKSLLVLNPEQVIALTKE